MHRYLREPAGCTLNGARAMRAQGQVPCGGEAQPLVSPRTAWKSAAREPVILNVR